MPGNGDVLLLVVQLKARSSKCFLCRLIFEDLEKNGKLTGYPLDWGGSATFPVDGKMKHLKLEGISLLLQ